MNTSITDAWQEYIRGVDFKNRIDLYSTVDENIRFYEGDQWHGISAPDLPKPVFNMIKPSCKFMSVQVKDRKLTLNYTAEGMGVGDDVKTLLTQIKQYARATWNRLGMEKKNLEGITDAFNTGDYILYHMWNTDKETGQPFKGDLDNAIIDNTNYYPGNPNSHDVQSQPYIIIVFRDMVENVREMARQNKMNGEIESIVQDEDTEYMSGDIGKVELDRHGKCNVLLRMWKDDGYVWFAKYTKYATVQKPVKSDLKLYPVAMMNWIPRKNCCHGVAECTYMKPNQVYINKQLAFTQLYLLQSAYPKVIYDKAAVGTWSNKVAGAIPVNGNVNDVARYMQPPQITFDVWRGPEFVLKQTMDLMGVNDAALGNIPNPDNKSAFIAVRESAIVPLQAQQERFYQMMKDMAMIWLDFWLAHYPAERGITYEENGERIQMPFELAKYRDLVYDCFVEVGESQMWSELNTVMTLDKLLQANKIKLSSYYKNIPDGYLPDKQGLIQEALQQEEQEMQMAQMAQMQGGNQSLSI